MAITPGSWSDNAKLVIQGDMVTGTHSNFTILITELVLPDDIFDTANADGGDLRFCSDLAGTTEHARDIILWDATSRQVIIAIGISFLSTVNQAVYVFYGNASVSDYAAAATFGAYNAYDSYTKAFWPLNESGTGFASEFKDRTTNANHGRGGAGNALKSPSQYPFLLNCGNDFDGSSDFIDFGTDASIGFSGAISVEAFFIRDTDSNGDLIMTKTFTDGGKQHYTLHATANDATNKAVLDVYFDSVSTQVKYTSASYLTAPVPDIVHHAAATWDGTTSGTNVYVYVDGDEDATAAKATSNSSSTFNCYVGSFYEASHFNGKIALVKVQSTDRSAGWVETTYNNVKYLTRFIKLEAATFTAAPYLSYHPILDKVFIGDSSGFTYTFNKNGMTKVTGDIQDIKYIDGTLLLHAPATLSQEDIVWTTNILDFGTSRQKYLHGFYANVSAFGEDVAITFYSRAAKYSSFSSAATATFDHDLGYCNAGRISGQEFKIEFKVSGHYGLYDTGTDVNFSVDDIIFVYETLGGRPLPGAS